MEKQISLKYKRDTYLRTKVTELSAALVAITDGG